MCARVSRVLGKASQEKRRLMGSCSQVELAEAHRAGERSACENEQELTGSDWQGPRGWSRGCFGTKFAHRIPSFWQIIQLQEGPLREKATCRVGWGLTLGDFAV